MTKKLKVSIGLIITLICCTTIMYFVHYYYNNTKYSMDVSIEGDSMLPTLVDGDTISLDLKFNYEDINHDDIVVFRKPDSEQLCVKRVVGLVGDKIEIKENNLFINGEQYNNVDDNKNLNFYIYDNSWHVGVNELFVVGDNYTNSVDSRNYGCIDKENILGVIKE